MFASSLFFHLWRMRRFILVCPRFLFVVLSVLFWNGLRSLRIACGVFVFFTSYLYMFWHPLPPIPPTRPAPFSPLMRYCTSHRISHFPPPDMFPCVIRIAILLSQYYILVWIRLAMRRCFVYRHSVFFLCLFICDIAFLCLFFLLWSEIRDARSLFFYGT